MQTVFMESHSSSRSGHYQPPLHGPQHL